MQRYSLLNVLKVALGSLSADRKPIAMAMLHAGRRQMNHVVTVHDGGRVVTRTRVVTSLFYDSGRVRMHV